MKLADSIYENALEHKDRLCGLMARVPGTDTEVSGSIPCATRYAEK
jgi:hypothetical protein